MKTKLNKKKDRLKDIQDALDSADGNNVSVKLLAPCSLQLILTIKQLYVYTNRTN